MKKRYTASQQCISNNQIQNVRKIIITLLKVLKGVKTYSTFLHTSYNLCKKDCGVA